MTEKGQGRTCWRARLKLAFMKRACWSKIFVSVRKLDCNTLGAEQHIIILYIETQTRSSCTFAELKRKCQQCNNLQTIVDISTCMKWSWCNCSYGFWDVMQWKHFKHHDLRSSKLLRAFFMILWQLHAFVSNINHSFAPKSLRGKVCFRGFSLPISIPIYRLRVPCSPLGTGLN